MERYSIEKTIGEGSYGRALLVRDRETEKRCVMKRVSLSRLDTKARAEAEQEAKLLARLRHPNIVGYVESFTQRKTQRGDGPTLCIVMEFCDGGDLEAHLKRRRGKLLPEHAVLDLFVQVCLALRHVHDKRVLHRDLKTANVFLTRRDIVKLVRPPAHAPQKQRLAAPTLRRPSSA